MRTIVFGLILALGLAVAGPARAAQSIPASLNLHLGDLPSGFSLSTDIMTTDAVYAKQEKQTIDQVQATGRIVGNDEEFDREALTGMVIIDSQVIQYVTVAAAVAAYRKTQATGPYAPDVKGIKQMSLSPVGARSQAWLYNFTNKGIKATMFAVVFQRSRYIGLVFTAGIRSTFGGDSLSPLAHIMDSRIQKNG